MSNRLFAAMAASFLLFSASCRAEDVYCEVMSVEGTVTLSNATTSGKPVREGDLLSVDDVVQVDSGSFVDLAYDRDWENVTRVEEGSSMRIRSLYPTEVELNKGGIFAKLKALPKDSTFEVQTPTAIATVRGTEYRTTYVEGQTEIHNVSDSDVFVYGLDAAGKKQETEPVVVRHSQKTFVPQRGVAPMTPRRMESAELERAAGFRQGIERNVRQNVERGRVAKLPDVGEIGRRIQERRAPGLMKDGMSGPGQNRPALSGDHDQRAVPGGAGPDRREDGEGPLRKGLGEPFFPGGERQRHAEGPETGGDRSKQRDGKSGQGRPSAKPRAQR